MTSLDRRLELATAATPSRARRSPTPRLVAPSSRTSANGVEVEERDGREFTVLRLPSIEPEVVSLAPRIEP